MKRDIEVLNSEKEYDLVVVGGGIQGAGIAREASLQGLKTLLVERGDFASGTSSRSTKLIHGGLRYLERGRFRLVSESLKEAKILSRMMPHWVRQQSFLFPIFWGDRYPKWQIRAGLAIYRHLQGAAKQIGGEWPRKKITECFPDLETKNLRGGFLYGDFTMNDSRICLEVLKAAYQLGCDVLNYMRLVGFKKEEGHITHAELRDLKTGETYMVRTKAVVNAAGIWADDVRLLADPGLKKKLRRSKGIHLVARRFFMPGAEGAAPAIVHPTSDRRMFFVIPWYGNTTLIGSTDTDFTGKPSECYALPEEADQILRQFRTLFPRVNLKRSDFHTTFTGLRALLDQPGTASQDLTREYEIEELPMGLVSVLGGKYTTFRNMAVKTVGKVLKLLNAKGRYEDTSCFSLAGLSLEEDIMLKKRELFDKQSNYYGISLAIRDHLWNTYGLNTFEIFKLIDYDPVLKEGVLPDRLPLKAEVVYAVKDEMALTLTDFLRRRSSLFYQHEAGADLLEGIARVYQDFLHWSDEEIARQKEAYLDEMKKNLAALDRAHF